MNDSLSPAPDFSPSVKRGLVGGLLLGVGGFLPWVLAGRPLSRALGEAGMYGVCAVVFIALSGPLLHRLLGGERTVRRFYALFLAAFSLYSVGWIVGWFALRGAAGGALGLALGCGAMAVVFAVWFAAWKSLLAMAVALFGMQLAGYFAGDVAYAWVGGMAEGSKVIGAVGKLSWGVFYGLGLGGGLGWALFLAQRGR